MGLRQLVHILYKKPAVFACFFYTLQIDISESKVYNTLYIITVIEVAV